MPPGREPNPNQAARCRARRRIFKRARNDRHDTAHLMATDATSDPLGPHAVKPSELPASTSSGANPGKAEDGGPPPTMTGRHCRERQSFRQSISDASAPHDKSPRSHAQPTPRPIPDWDIASAAHAPGPASSRPIPHSPPPPLGWRPRPKAAPPMPNFWAKNQKVNRAYPEQYPPTPAPDRNETPRFPREFESDYENIILKVKSEETQISQPDRWFATRPYSLV